MARKKRFHLPTAVYHVMLRGNDGQNIFFSDQDRCRMCLLMQEGIERFGHRIHAFCFMSNHIHLAIQVGDINISRVMQNLAFRYTRYINETYGRVGHLFQGRFKSVLVDLNTYFHELIRYIHLNPVRAGLSKQPENYRWSSHPVFLSLEEIPWVTSDPSLKIFGDDRKKAIGRFHEFVLKGIDLPPCLDFKSGLRGGVMGDEKFLETIVDREGISQKPEVTLADLIAKVCDRYNLSENILCSQEQTRSVSHARAMLALYVREAKTLCIEDLAQFLKREASGLSKLANRLHAKSRTSHAVASEILELKMWAENFVMSDCQA
jgi:putative transposase